MVARYLNARFEDTWIRRSACHHTNIRDPITGVLEQEPHLPLAILRLVHCCSESLLRAVIDKGLKSLLASHVYDHILCGLIPVRQ